MANGPGDSDGAWNDIPSAASLNAQRRLQVSVISPSAEAFVGTATAVRVPAHDGDLGILYGHAPMVVLLGTGTLHVEDPDGARQFHVSRGFLQVVDNEVSVLAEEVQALETNDEGSTGGGG